MEYYGIKQKRVNPLTTSETENIKEQKNNWHSMDKEAVLKKMETSVELVEVEKYLANKLAGT